MRTIVLKRESGLHSRFAGVGDLDENVAPVIPDMVVLAQVARLGE